MEFIPTIIEVRENAHNPDGSHTKITFKKDCTESRRYDRWGRPNNHVQNMQTYNHPDPTKDENLIFPKMFTDLFQVMFTSGSNMFQNYVDLKDNGHAFLQYVFKSMVVPFTNLEKENNHLRGQLESKDQELAQMKEQLESKDQELAQMKEQLAQMKKQLESKDQEIKISLLTASTLTSAIVAKDEELEEKDQYFEFMLQELNETQEQLKDTEQELKDTQEEIKTRGLLLKSCVEDLKTYAEEVEEVENKNQELEHLNHRLIYETSSFKERNSYFSPEM
jgi:septal ring factor EnvC (AmiA/AmiB activator)